MVKVNSVLGSWNSFKYMKGKPSSFDRTLVLRYRGEVDLMPTLLERPSHPDQRENIAGRAESSQHYSHVRRTSAALVLWVCLGIMFHIISPLSISKFHRFR